MFRGVTDDVRAPWGRPERAARVGHHGDRPEAAFHAVEHRGDLSSVAALPAGREQQLPMIGFDQEWYGSALSNVTLTVAPLGTVYSRESPTEASISAPPSGELGE